VKTRSANEWREFWRERIREHELGLDADPCRDTRLAARVHDWFESA
jgi:hypothetical protein